MGILEVLSMHLECEPFSREWVFWIPREWNAAADSLATRAIEKREDAFFLNSRWHMDKWRRADVVMMSDTGFWDNLSRPGMKQQGMGFLMMHRDTRELLAAASLFGETNEARRHQHLGGDDDGSMDRRGTDTLASEFTRPEIRTLRTKVATCTHRWKEGSR